MCCLVEKWLRFYSGRGHLESFWWWSNNNYDTIWGYMSEYWKLSLKSFQQLSHCSALANDFYFCTSIFSTTIQRAISIQKYNELLNNEKNLKSEKGKSKKANKVLQEFCQLRGKSQMWVNYNWDNWIAPVFYFSLSEGNTSPRCHIFSPRYQLYLIYCYCAFIHSLFYSIKQICVKYQL